MILKRVRPSTWIIFFIIIEWVKSGLLIIMLQFQLLKSVLKNSNSSDIICIMYKVYFLKSFKVFNYIYMYIFICVFIRG
jgi:hypothetical protein